MVELALHEVGREPLRRSGALALDREPWTSTELSFVEPPRVELAARETGDGGIHVTGRLSGTIQVRCRRCLEPVRQTLDVEVDWLFEPDVDEEAEDEGVFTLKDEEEGVLDLAPRIREEFLLEAPAYPLCSDDCQGLCPVCGTNQNDSSCECDTSEMDPRWGPLEDLASS